MPYRAAAAAVRRTLITIQTRAKTYQPAAFMLVAMAENDTKPTARSAKGAVTRTATST
jgi:hypothetical protein